MNAGVDMTDHVSRFHSAISVLAAHGHIKQRLIKAFEENLAAIDEQDLPAALRDAFADLRGQMLRVAPANGEGRVCASVRKMSVEEASECAVAMVSLFEQLLRARSDMEDVLPMSADAASRAKQVPPFLVKAN